MARVNLDGKVWKDPRVRRLAKRCGWSIRETVGTLAAVWDVAYDAKNPVMAAIDIDTAAELDGFAAALQADDVQLGDPVQGGVRLHGVLERIQYLLSQAERGRLGGLAKAANAERSASTGLANAKQTPSTAQASSKQPPSLPLAPDLPPPPPPALSPDQENPSPPAPVRVIGKLKGCTPQEQAQAAEVLERLAARSGRKYGGSAKHQALVISRLRAGYTVWDMRRVIGYCAIELGWEDKPTMQPFLRPETLFGPEAMEKYVYAARAWEPAEEPPPDTPNAPRLTIVKNSAEPVTDEWSEPEWMTAMSTPR